MVSKNLSVCLSVYLSVTKFDPNHLKTGKTEWAEIFLGHLWQKVMFQNFFPSDALLATNFIIKWLIFPPKPKMPS